MNNDTSSPPVVQNWDSFRYLLEAVRHQSITAAARILDSSQPTVSRKIRELEEQLGVKLIDRVPSGIKTTPAGQAILERIERIDQEANAIRDSIEGLNQRAEGRVVLTAPEGFGVEVLVPHLAAFRAQYPLIDLELMLGTTRHNLLNREADVAIRIGQTGPSTLVGRNIGVVRFGLFTTQKYLETAPRLDHVRDLHRHQVICAAGGLAQTTQIEELRRLAPNANRILRTNSVVAQRDAVLAGHGIAPLPTYFGKRHARLIEVLPRALTGTDNLWILTHSDLKDLARISATTQFFGAVARREL